MTEQNFVAAARWCAKAVAQHEFLAEDCSNLAFIVFNYCSKTTTRATYQYLNASGLKERSSTPAIFLRLSFEIALQSEAADALVRRDFLEAILKPSIKVTPPLPIIFWHIPKCSGTSINHALSHHFYGQAVNQVWPGYSYRPLVTYLFSHLLHEIPYAPSVHLGMGDLKPSTPHFSFAVLRDPVKRCLSMYRQEAAANRALSIREEAWHHYRAFPRYGYFWDYRADRTFEAWLRHVPGTLLQRQLSTFSSRHDISAAMKKLTSLDYFFFRDLTIGSERKLFEQLELPYDPDSIPDSMNESDKSIELPDNAQELATAYLSREVELVSRLK